MLSVVVGKSLFKRRVFVFRVYEVSVFGIFFSC